MSNSIKNQIKMIEAKLQEVGVDVNDKEKCIACLEKVVASEFCIEIYKKYIMKGG